MLAEFDSSRKRKIELAQSAVRQDAFFRGRALGRFTNQTKKEKKGGLAAQDEVDGNRKIVVVKRRTSFDSDGLPIVDYEKRNLKKKRNSKGAGMSKSKRQVSLKRPFARSPNRTKPQSPLETVIPLTDNIASSSRNYTRDIHSRLSTGNKSNLRVHTKHGSKK